jgi:CheY-like chemotaxis protein
MNPADIILIVDDDPDIRKITRLSLSRVGGFAVEEAASGQEALEILASLCPKVVLLDVMMPHMDGAKVLAEIRASETHKHLPVVFLSAKVQIQEVQRYLNMGANGVITKPFNPLTLPHEIRKIIAA